MELTIGEYNLYQIARLDMELNLYPGGDFFV